MQGTLLTGTPEKLSRKESFDTSNSSCDYNTVATIAPGPSFQNGVTCPSVGPMSGEGSQRWGRSPTPPFHQGGDKKGPRPHLLPTRSPRTQGLRERHQPRLRPRPILHVTGVLHGCCPASCSSLFKNYSGLKGAVAIFVASEMASRLGWFGHLAAFCLT